MTRVLQFEGVFSLQFKMSQLCFTSRIQILFLLYYKIHCFVRIYEML